MPPVHDTWAVPSGQAPAAGRNRPSGGSGTVSGLGPGSGLAVGEALDSDGTAEAIVAMNSLNAALGDGGIDDPTLKDAAVGGDRGGGGRGDRELPSVRPTDRRRTRGRRASDTDPEALADRETREDPGVRRARLTLAAWLGGTLVLVSVLTAVAWWSAEPDAAAASAKELANDAAGGTIVEVAPPDPLTEPEADSGFKPGDAVLAETESLAAEEADALPAPGRVPAPGTPASNAAETGTEADGDR